jgi:aspartyl-tRNA(Asn)/glutamyl-tRNA(Gln) amidotransferase subunit A
MHGLGATELLALYARSEVSPVEVLRAVLARVEHCEPKIAALWALDAEAVQARAHDSEMRWRHGRALALDGVPVTLKENIATLGLPVPMGTAASDLVPAAADAPPAARLREAGTVMIAKTTMPDYGMLSSGVSSFHKLTRNPWDLSKSPGGSSAGAAAACAAGYGPIHLGTDIGGSIRLPAGWCGIVGFKPSLGRLPIHPPYAGRVAGPMTRTVEDAALAMSVLTRPDARDTMSLPWQDIAWRDLEVDLRGLRLGLWLDAGWGTPVAPDVRAAVEAAAGAFERCGAIVEWVPPFTTRAMADGMDDFWRMRSWLEISALPVERQARVLPFIRQWAARGETLSGTRVFRGFSQMGALRDAAVAATQRFDFMLSPVSPDVAFAAELAMPSNDPERPFEHIAFTLPFNMSEQPAIAVPAGHDASGLPIGLQIAGRRHDDLGVLRIARAWERLRGPQREYPSLA